MLSAFLSHGRKAGSKRRHNVRHFSADRNASPNATTPSTSGSAGSAADRVPAPVHAAHRRGQQRGYDDADAAPRWSPSPERADPAPRFNLHAPFPLPFLDGTLRPATVVFHRPPAAQRRRDRARAAHVVVATAAASGDAAAAASLAANAAHYLLILQRLKIVSKLLPPISCVSFLNMIKVILYEDRVWPLKCLLIVT